MVEVRFYEVSRQPFGACNAESDPFRRVPCNPCQLYMSPTPAEVHVRPGRNQLLAHA